MLTRRDVLASASAAVLVVDPGKGPVWRPIDQIGRDLHGCWENTATGHVVQISSAGAEVFHRLDDVWFRDPGLTPEFRLFAHEGDILRLQAYDYRATPFLLQAPALLKRTDAMPPPTVLAQDDRRSPAEVFDLICRSFDRHYAFFPERGVDWDAARGASSSDLADDRAVFDRLSQMLAPLGDGHVNLSSGTLQFNAGKSALRDRLGQSWRAAGSEGAEQDFVSRWSRDSRSSTLALLDPGSYRSGANAALEWGRIGRSGYLRINRFSGFLDGASSRQEQVEALTRTLAQAEADFLTTRHVIVDVVHNGGGNDAAAMVVARHFADRPRRVLTYATRNMPDQTIDLQPGATAYPRPVTLVTSEITASAAECFVVMMRAFPHVAHMGGRTRGILSSMLPKPFPNGFMATMAYQRVLDAQGALYEARGILPTREMAVFPESDLGGGYARVIDQLARDEGV
ncbi:MAG: S41 family peptidase [Brevundimonas sp.]|uniref:S41 family peptidase n=1 Tax=Brevundimonas sp. TaxID=1871086 RepID=UPI0040344801